LHLVPTYVADAVDYRRGIIVADRGPCRSIIAVRRFAEIKPLNAGSLRG
jgi:hypothetical protein